MKKILFSLMVLMVSAIASYSQCYHTFSVELVSPAYVTSPETPVTVRATYLPPYPDPIMLEGEFRWYIDDVLVFVTNYMGDQDHGHGDWTSTYSLPAGSSFVVKFYDPTNQCESYGSSAYIPIVTPCTP